MAYKKVFLLFFLFFSLTCFSSQKEGGSVDSAPPLKKSKHSPLTKISDRLYKIFDEESGLCFAIQRIDLMEDEDEDEDASEPKKTQKTQEDIEAYDFWALFSNLEIADANLDAYQNKAKELEKSNPLAFKKNIVKGFLKEKAISLSGYAGFDASIKYFTHNELWIAFVLDHDIEKSSDIDEESIEMAVPVLTHPTSPIVTHLGITRSLDYLIKVANEEKFLHPSLSIKLHAFAALFMKQRYSHLQYMITRPTYAMTKIFKDTLKEDEIFIGTNKDQAENILQQALQDKEIVLKEDEEKQKSDYIARIQNIIPLDKCPSPIYFHHEDEEYQIFRLYDTKKESILLEAKISNNLKYPLLKNLTILEKTHPHEVYDWFFEHEHMNLEGYFYVTIILDRLTQYFN